MDEATAMQKAQELIVSEKRNRESLCGTELRQAINAICAKYNCRLDMFTVIRNGEVSHQWAPVSLG